MLFLARHVAALTSLQVVHDFNVPPSLPHAAHFMADVALPSIFIFICGFTYQSKVEL